MRDRAVPKLVLASSSPQRAQILERVGASFTVCPADVQELALGDPREVALQNAMLKARAVRDMRRRDVAEGDANARGEAEEEASECEVVLGVDTLVTLEGRIYGKPEDEGEARATLSALSGVDHEVLSGVALLFADGEERTTLAATTVSFRELDEPLLDWYLGTQEWRGRAGGYAIQGAGTILVRAIRGDYENVVGLPLASLLDLHPSLLGDRGGLLSGDF